jgi:hypothetical protein
MPESAQPVSDMATPDQLRVRWGLLAAVFAGVGIAGVYTLTDDGAYLNDHGGNWAALMFAGERRIVFYGYDHEYSETVDADPPVDLLDGGPPWLPWARLGELAGDGQLGWCYWHDTERWLRNPAASAVPDGREAAAPGVLSDEFAVRELAAAVRHGGAPGQQELPAPSAAVTFTEAVNNAGAALMRAAYRSAIDDGALGSLLRFGRVAEPDGLERAMAVAAAAGLTPGSRSPLDRAAPPAAARPRRRRRRLSERQHEELVWSALRSAQETPREAPAAAGEARDLAAWLSRHGYLRPDRPTVGFQICARSSTAQGLKGISFENWREVAGLAKRLRQAEAHPEQGQWIWLRVVLAESGQAWLERAYDHLPSWWDGPPEGLWLSDLAAEIDQRAAAWRPAWAGLLDPQVAWEEI